MHQLSLGELVAFFGHFAGGHAQLGGPAKREERKRLVSMCEMPAPSHCADMGYGVVSREDNLPWGIGCCAEFTLVKVEKPANC